MQVLYAAARILTLSKRRVWPRKSTCLVDVVRVAMLSIRWLGRKFLLQNLWVVASKLEFLPQSKKAMKCLKMIKRRFLTHQWCLKSSKAIENLIWTEFLPSIHLSTLQSRPQKCFTKIVKVCCRNSWVSKNNFLTFSAWKDSMKSNKSVIEANCAKKRIKILLLCLYLSNKIKSRRCLCQLLQKLTRIYLLSYQTRQL